MCPEAEIKLGQRYRETGNTAFGTPNPRVWVVRDIRRDSDGLTHVRLMSEVDGTRIKSISALALTDRQFFVPETGSN